MNPKRVTKVSVDLTKADNTGYIVELIVKNPYFTLTKYAFPTKQKALEFIAEAFATIQEEGE